MAEIRPFRGLRYNLQKIQDMGSVISPPYDVISADQKRELQARSPFNVVRLILPDGDEPYENAKNILRTWIHEEILVTEKDPAVYCYHQTYVTPENIEVTRRGFLALIRLEEFEKGIVLPHEATLSAPKEDRLELLRACKTNFSPIFSLYSDPQKRIEALLDPFVSEAPLLQARAADGILNSLWAITDPDIIKHVARIMSDQWVLIADGHHRYESRLMYRNESSRKSTNPDAPFQFSLMFFSNLDHPGITVLPYNRATHSIPNFDGAAVRRKAQEFLETQEFHTKEEANSALRKTGKDTAWIAVYEDSDKYFLYQLKRNIDLEQFYDAGTPLSVQRLDVNILHKVFLETILGISLEDLKQQKYLKYYKDEAEENKDFESGKLQVAFYLNPTRVEQVVEVSKAGKKMPQKSTFFYPKLMTGLVMRSMQSEL